MHKTVTKSIKLYNKHLKKSPGCNIERNFLKADHSIADFSSRNSEIGKSSTRSNR